MKKNTIKQSGKKTTMPFIVHLTLNWAIKIKPSLREIIVCEGDPRSERRQINSKAFTGGLSLQERGFIQSLGWI